MKKAQRYLRQIYKLILPGLPLTEFPTIIVIPEFTEEEERNAAALTTVDNYGFDIIIEFDYSYMKTINKEQLLNYIVHEAFHAGSALDFEEREDVRPKDMEIIEERSARVAAVLAVNVSKHKKKIDELLDKILL